MVAAVASCLLREPQTSAPTFTINGTQFTSRGFRKHSQHAGSHIVAAYRDPEAQAIIGSWLGGRTSDGQ